MKKKIPMKLYKHFDVQNTVKVNKLKPGVYLALNENKPVLMVRYKRYNKMQTMFCCVSCNVPYEIAGNLMYSHTIKAETGFQSDFIKECTDKAIGFRRIHIDNYNKVTKSSDKIVQEIKFYFEKDMNKTHKVEVGIELELEHDAGSISASGFASFTSQNMPVRKFIQGIGTDASVKGCEIRFKHFALKDWKSKPLAQYFAKLRALEYGVDKCTAGQHVHVSGVGFDNLLDIINLGQAYTDEYPEEKQQFRLLKYIIEPTNDRNSERGYGRGSDMIRPNCEFGTIEFRAWRATLNPFVFLTRAELAKRIFEHVQNGKSLRTFFRDMPVSFRKKYCALIDACKYHVCGENPEIMKRIAMNGELI